MTPSKTVSVGTHWGNYRVLVEDGKIRGVRPAEYDPNPSPIGRSLRDALDPDCRIPQPMVRAGYLERGAAGDGSLRGKEPFVPVSWDQALDIAADALKRVIEEYGNEAIFGGSYGWASAGRFHHAQSQIHRFLRLIGGYTDAVFTYSAAACEAIMPHVLGCELYTLAAQGPIWNDVVEAGGLVVAFGGMRLDNSQVNPGGVGAHLDRGWQQRARERGVEVVNISPIRDDTADFLQADWYPILPNTDTALMLGVAYTLVEEGLHDRAFLETYCTGFERFLPYLTGATDGIPKTPAWAASITGIAADRIADLARRMAGKRTMIALAFSLQRAEHGEQPFWMATVLAAMLGQHGLPGGGVSYGHATCNLIGYMGRRFPLFGWGAVPQGVNPIKTFIPVSRIADMLLNPGLEYDFDGRKLKYPDIKLIYWAGGNPFHHHQDLNRLRRAWARPQTVIVNDSVWTATARHADIVFPATTMLERDDIVCGYDHYIMPSRRAVPAYGEARNDYEIFSELARRFDLFDAFTEGRSGMDWIRHLYETSVANAAKMGVNLPDFDAFWQGEAICLEDQLFDLEFMLEAFRKDPAANPLGTPSGKIEIFSRTVDGFGYDDCPGHPVWLDKEEWLRSPRAGRFPLHLLSNQPKSRLHSQFDFGIVSRETKVRGREPARMHPDDAGKRGIRDGDVVRIFNDRGACLAGIILSEDLMPGVIQLSTGAWFDPATEGEEGLERHGNPNVLTPDRPSSRLGQALTAYSCLVEVEPYDGPLPEVRAHRPPEILAPAR